MPFEPGVTGRGNPQLQSNEPRRLQLPEDFRFSVWGIGSQYETGGVPPYWLVEARRAEVSFAEHGPNTSRLRRSARVLKQAGRERNFEGAKTMSWKSQGLEPLRRNAEVTQNRAGTKDDGQVELRRVECILEEPLFKRILRRVFPDQRRQERLPEPPLVGYLGTACSSKPYGLGDISLAGFCLLTDERWMPGTEMPITLKRTNLPAESDVDCFTVQATVVRCDTNGVGFSIVLSEEGSMAAHGNPLRVRWVTHSEMERFLQRLKEQPSSTAQPSEGPIPATSIADSEARAGVPLKAAFESGR